MGEAVTGIVTGHQRCCVYYCLLLYVFFWVFPRRPSVVCRRFGTLYQFHLIEGSETSANHNRTPGKYPREYIQDSKHGESLKSRILFVVFAVANEICKWRSHFNMSLVRHFVTACYGILKREAWGGRLRFSAETCGLSDRQTDRQTWPLCAFILCMSCKERNSVCKLKSLMGTYRQILYVMYRLFCAVLCVCVCVFVLIWWSTT